MTLKSDNNQFFYIIRTYNPTLEKSKQNLKIRDNFYSKLNVLIKTHKSKNIAMAVGDFIAKTSSSESCIIYHSTIDRDGNRLTNENGRHLQFAILNNLTLTNKFFKHKPLHITNGQSPASLSNNICQNKCGNQNGNVLIRDHILIKPTSSRSYGGMQIPSDHEETSYWEYKENVSRSIKDLEKATNAQEQRNLNFISMRLMIKARKKNSEKKETQYVQIHIIESKH